MSKKVTTSEEGILELRKIVASFGGLDPRYGQVIKPIEPVSEEKMKGFLNALFTRDKANE